MLPIHSLGHSFGSAKSQVFFGTRKPKRAALVAMVLFSLAAAPTAAIVLIQGNPFEQPSAVSPAPIAAAVEGVRAASVLLLER